MNNKSNKKISIFCALFPFLWALIMLSGGLVFCFMSLILDLKTSVYIIHPFIAFICFVMCIGFIWVTLMCIKDIMQTIEKVIDKKESV